jgi:predicted DNA-binding transcriptional regulator AlpA
MDKKKPSRILPPQEVAYRLGFSTQTLYALETKGIIPRRVRQSPRRTGWLEEDIEAYISTLQRVVMEVK